MIKNNPRKFIRKKNESVEDPHELLLSLVDLGSLDAEEALLACVTEMSDAECKRVLSSLSLPGCCDEVDDEMSVEVDEPSTEVEFPSDEEDDAEEVAIEDDTPEDEDEELLVRDDLTLAVEVDEVEVVRREVFAFLTFLTPLPVVSLRSRTFASRLFPMEMLIVADLPLPGGE